MKALRGLKKTDVVLLVVWVAGFVVGLSVFFPAIERGDPWVAVCTVFVAGAALGCIGFILAISMLFGLWPEERTA